MNGNGRLMEIRKFNFGILKVHVLELNERLKHVLALKCSNLSWRVLVMFNTSIIGRKSRNI